MPWIFLEAFLCPPNALLALGQSFFMFYYPHQNAAPPPLLMVPLVLLETGPKMPDPGSHCVPEACHTPSKGGGSITLGRCRPLYPPSFKLMETVQLLCLLQFYPNPSVHVSRTTRSFRESSTTSRLMLIIPLSFSYK